MALFTQRLGQWALGIMALVAVLAGLTAAGWTAPVEDAAAVALGPVQRALRRATEPVADLLSKVDEFDRLHDENQALRNRIEQVEADNARLREEQIQVQGRQALLAVQQEQADQIFLTADVITRDLTGVRHIIGVNQGKDDGVAEGMPVLAAGGTLVGVVMDVRAHSSFVRLITDPDSSVRALHQRTRTEGVVRGDTLGNLNVEFVPQATDVQPGQLFVTSGLGGLLPKGIPVGRVSSAEGSAQDVFRRIRLQPLAPLQQLETVLIQVTFQASPLTLPDGSPPAAEPPAGEPGQGQASP